MSSRPYLIGAPRRLIIFQPITGSMVDLGARDLRGSISYAPRRQTMKMGDGREWARSSTHTLSATITDPEAERFLRVMRRIGCPVRAIVIGEEAQLYFGADAEIVPSDEYPATGTVRGTGVRLRSHVKYADVSVGHSLIKSVPWEGTETVSASGSEAYHLEPPRHRWGGRVWGTDEQSVSPDITGAAPNLTSSTPAILRTVIPAWGAEVRVEFPEDKTGSGSVEAFDWDANGIQSFNLETKFTIPLKTWYLKLQIDSAEAYPQLLVDDPGEAYGVLEGEITSDCQTKATSPHWNETSIDLLDENT